MRISQDLLDQFTRPLARLCLENSIHFQELTTSLKKAMVAEATMLLENDDVTPTTVKLSVMTGLQRPDVLKHGESATPQSKPSVISQIVSTWLYSGRFKNKRGEPRVLSPEGRDSEFAKLVAVVSKELSPYTILFEMERAGLIEHTDDGVRLLSSTHLVKTDVKAGLEILSRDLSDLTDAVIENLKTEISENLHVRMEYDNIPVRQIPEVKEKLFRLAHQFLHQAQELVASYDRDMQTAASDSSLDSADAESRARLALTVFSYSATGY